MSYRLPTLAISALAIGGVLAASAPAEARKKDRQYRPYAADRIYDRPDRFGWYPRNADQLKFGSAIWFEQMEREGRFGGSRRIR